MAQVRLSSKHIQVDKANAVIIGSLATAVFVVIFSVVAIKALLNQSAYYRRVSSKKEKALKVLKENNESVSKLSESYRQFIAQNPNAIGGNSTGTGDRDGDNAKLVLDALPSKYDFPAMVTSLDKLLTGFTVEAISGNDEEVAQGSAAANGSPQAIEMPFTLDATVSYATLPAFL